VVAVSVKNKRLITSDPEHRVPHLAFQPDRLSKAPILPIAAVETSYYLRMRVKDRPGVLADITRILADSKISIDAMVQKEPEAGERNVDIVMLTHRALEKNVIAAMKSASGRGSFPALCAQSARSSDPAARIVSAIRSSGWITPVSLLTCWIATSVGPSASAASSAASSISPFGCTAMTRELELIA